MRISTAWNWIRDWWRRLKGHERLSLIFEFVIVLATTCYAVIALLQWKTMATQATIMATQAVTEHQMTEITKRSIAAEVTLAEATIFNPGTTESVIQLCFHNSGKLTAHQSAVHANFEFKYAPPPGYDPATEMAAAIQNAKENLAEAKGLSKIVPRTTCSVRNEYL
jgi:enoyl reductase-like protein